MKEYILSDAGAVIFLLMIIFGVISSVVKSAKEKKEREERARRSQGGSPGGSSSSQKQSTSRSGPSSIEDFLRELAGESKPARKEQPAPQSQKQEREWHASQGGIEDFLKKAEQDKAQKEREQREIREREKRKRSDQKERERQKKLKELERERRRKKPSRRFAGEIEDVHGDAYSEKAETVVRELDLSGMNTADLRKAFVMKEVLGPPVSLKDSSDTDYPAL